MKTPATLLTAAMVALLAGCGDAPDAAPAARVEAPATNRIDIPPAVRQNLGITFAAVESRNVARTLRVPGRFELLPDARREYHVPLRGRVELLVEQYQEVAEGTPLYRLDAPGWRDLQRELADAEAAVTLAQARLDSMGPFLEAHEAHHVELQHTVDLWAQRVKALEQLQAAGGARGDAVSDAKAALAAARADFAETLEKEAELVSRGSEAAAQLEAAKLHLRILLESAASLTALTVADLATVQDGMPRWLTLGPIEVSALSAGAVDVIHAISGSFVEPGAPVLTTVRPDRVRFRAHALQSDLGRLAGDLPATVVAPGGGSLAGSAPVPGALTLALTADAERRTIELIMTPGGPVPPWARAGVSAILEVVVAGTGTQERAIPLACVARDGTQSIIFRRDPADPNKAIRMEADLGLDDGRWVVIKSGVAEGDQIVLDGVYQLMVATSGSITKGGHFHPDGTFHEGDE